VTLRSPLPNEIEESLRQHFRRALAEHDCRIIYLAPATSADIVFLETVAERGGETHIMLSEPKDRFVAALLESSSNAGWRARCEAALGQAQHVLDSGEQRAGSVSAYAQRLMHGLARLHAARLDSRVVSIGLREPAVDPDAAGPADQHTEDDRIVAILFADVPRFTRLSEEQLPSFVEHLLGNVRLVASTYSEAILSRNTWGDGLYFVFSGVSDAGRFALDLSDRLALIDWPGHGLPLDLGLRIALHAGPAYRFVDPVTGAVTYTGPHVSRAARLEPITPPRHVYTSEAFAALAATDAPELRCDYVGRTSMAKGYGVFPTYHLRRSGT
jgi:class 3 adenylate cyclase